MDFDEEKTFSDGQGALATVGTDTARKEIFYSADTEVIADNRKRKRYTEGYKKKVVEHLSILRRDSNGDIGGYLRREGLYYTMVRKWEKKFQMGEGKKIKSAGSKGSSSRERELEEKVKNLERELEKTKKSLKKSEMIIDFQKKISLLLNPDQEDQQDQK